MPVNDSINEQFINLSLQTDEIQKLNILNSKLKFSELIMTKFDKITISILNKIDLINLIYEEKFKNCGDAGNIFPSCFSFTIDSE